MAATTTLMTVEEFCKLPEDNGPFYHELRHGELIAVPRPKNKRIRTQKIIGWLLEAVAGERGFVIVELPFRAFPEHELRVADVAYLSNVRWDGIDPDDNLRGAPDIVVEVLSPSNTVMEIYDKEKLCLENGSKEFWVVDPDRRQIKVSTPDGHTITYQSGQQIPLPLFDGATLSVDAVFA